MINDMQYHIMAWHKTLNNLGATISLEETKHQCYGKNNELLERTFPGRFTDEEKNVMSIEKEKAYQNTYLPDLKEIDGLEKFLQKTKDNKIKTAIGSAAIKFNIDFVLNNLNLQHYFDAIVCADDVVESKPNAETYLKCASALHTLPQDCIVFEDVPKGVESAANAGMKCIVISGEHHSKQEFDKFDNVIAFVNNYNEINFDWLINLK
jgi:beta-phosphoglucomutase